MLWVCQAHHADYTQTPSSPRISTIPAMQATSASLRQLVEQWDSGTVRNGRGVGRGVRGAGTERTGLVSAIVPQPRVMRQPRIAPPRAQHQNYTKTPSSSRIPDHFAINALILTLWHTVKLWNSEILRSWNSRWRQGSGRQGRGAREQLRPASVTPDTTPARPHEAPPRATAPRAEARPPRDVGGCGIRAYPLPNLRPRSMKYAIVS